MNRIKIQVILLILQLETDYFSSYSFQKCSIRCSGTTVFTETSRTAILHKEVLQHSSAPILQGYPYTIHKLHTENSPSRIQFYMQKTKSSLSTTTTIYRGQRDLHSRKENSMHRRQGDLLEIHPCVFQDLPKTFQAFQPKDLPKAFQRFQSLQAFQTFQSFMTFQPFQAILQIPVSPGNSPHSSILQSECIFYRFYKFYSSIGFHRKLHRGPVEQIQTFYKHSFFKEREML